MWTMSMSTGLGMSTDKQFIEEIPTLNSRRIIFSQQGENKCIQEKSTKEEN